MKISSGIKRLFTGIRLLCTSPGAFVRRVQYLRHAAGIRKMLAEKAASSTSLPIWLRYGENEFAYHGDEDGQEVIYHMHFDEWFSASHALFAEYIRPGDTVVDVGGNLGFTTLVFSRLAGGAGRVHSFEPGPRMFAKLSGMAARNELINVTLHNCGCGSKSESLVLNIPASSGNASLRPTDEVMATVKHQDTVQIRRLDDELCDLEALSFIKVDTEGFEIEVLRGAEKLIQKFRPVIYIELSQEYQRSSSEAIAWLKERRYVFEIEPDLNAAHNGDNFIVRPAEELG